MGDRYKLGDIDNERFYQIPKSLLINPKYKKISNTSKIMYAILKDRMELSRKNGWCDDNGDIYLLFSQEEMAYLLGTTKSTIIRNMKELADTQLIDSVRQGLCKPNKIYINRPEQFQEVVKTTLPEVAKMQPTEVAKMQLQEVANCYPNDTDSIDTDLSDTDRVNIIGAKAPSRKPKRKFVPPSLEEVEAYITEKQLNINPKAFWDYYESAEWHDSKGKAIRSWKQKCLMWVNYNKDKQVQKPAPSKSKVDWSVFDG
jgi:hypothetical protein